MAIEYDNWNETNQFYLMGMIKVIKNQFENYLASENDKELSKDDYSLQIQELQAIAANMKEPPAINNLAEKLQLSYFERDVLLLCVGIELDSTFTDLLLSENAKTKSPHLSFSLAFALFDEATWEAISPSGRLRFWQLIEINKGEVLATSPIKIDEHILHYLAGLDNIDYKLKTILTLVEPKDLFVPSEIQVADLVFKTIQQYTEQSIFPVLQVFGDELADKLRISANVAYKFGLALYEISIYSIPASIEEINKLCRLWNREAIIKNYALLLDATALDVNDKIQMQSVRYFIDNMEGLVFMSCDHELPGLKKRGFRITLKKPSSAEQLFLWKSILNGNADQSELEKIVSQFNLGGTTIQKAGIEILDYKNNQENENDTKTLRQKLWKTCCNYAGMQLDELAEKMEALAKWDDIVLPELQKNTLKEIAIHVRQRSRVYSKWGFEKKGSRGLGISVLFAGESGTGKTMAAEVLANELNLDLYKIDLSRVINKYIGETEKNLKKIFDAAENGGAILLFDEADALFGKRSDIKDSHDRYSNIEVSYLLQRMEAYRGLAILTTNMKSVLDKAFLRRIRFVVQFPFPDLVQRAEIWNKVFPADTPLKNIDINKLARLNLAGGSIRNVALNAAFFAADEDRPVLMSHLARAARSEYLKMEKQFSNIDLT